VRRVVVSIAAGLAGLACWGVCPASAGTSISTPSAANAQIAVERSMPPVLLASTLTPATAMPIASVRSPMPVIAQGSFVRAVRPPGSSQPGVLWVIVIGAVLYRFGSRVLRVS
jgi:hypothetical protein